jgi:hypothetical protein
MTTDTQTRVPAADLQYVALIHTSTGGTFVTLLDKGVTSDPTHYILDRGDSDWSGYWVSDLPGSPSKRYLDCINAGTPARPSDRHLAEVQFNFDFYEWIQHEEYDPEARS